MSRPNAQLVYGIMKLSLVLFLFMFVIKCRASLIRENGTCGIDSYLLNGTCTVHVIPDCPVGYSGENCSYMCPVGFYGKDCVQVCVCKSYQICDNVLGCSRIKRTGNSTTFPDEQPSRLTFHWSLLILFFGGGASSVLLPAIFCFCRRRWFGNRQDEEDVIEISPPPEAVPPQIEHNAIPIINAEYEDVVEAEPIYSVSDNNEYHTLSFSKNRLERMSEVLPDTSGYGRVADHHRNTAEMILPEMTSGDGAWGSEPYDNAFCIALPMFENDTEYA